MIVESDLNLQHNLFSSSNSNISLIGQLQIDFTEHSVRSCVEQNWSTATIALPTKHHCLNPLQSKSILKSNRWVTPIDRCHVSLQVHRVAHTNTSTHTLTRIQTYITLHTHTHTHTSPVAQSQVAISRRRRPPSSVSSLPWSISTKKRIYCHILVRRYQHFSINKPANWSQLGVESNCLNQQASKHYFHLTAAIGSPLVAFKFDVCLVFFSPLIKHTSSTQKLLLVLQIATNHCWLIDSSTLRLHFIDKYSWIEEYRNWAGRSAYTKTATTINEYDHKGSNNNNHHSIIIINQQQQTTTGSQVAYSANWGLFSSRIIQSPPTVTNLCALRHTTTLSVSHKSPSIIIHHNQTSFSLSFIFFFSIFHSHIKHKALSFDPVQQIAIVSSSIILFWKFRSVLPILFIAPYSPVSLVQL